MLKSPELLSEATIATLCTEHTPWQLQNDSTLAAAYSFGSFADALDFVVRIGVLAEELQHHPLITIEHRNVTLRTTTREAGDQLTERDAELVRGVAPIAQAFSTDVARRTGE